MKNLLGLFNFPQPALAGFPQLPISQQPQKASSLFTLGRLRTGVKTGSHTTPSDNFPSYHRPRRRYITPTAEEMPLIDIPTTPIVQPKPTNRLSRFIRSLRSLVSTSAKHDGIERS